MLRSSWMTTCALLAGVLTWSAFGVIGPNDRCLVPTPYPPPEAGAGVLNNPDMEGGFTDGKANQWVAWQDRGFAIAVHAVGNDRFTNGAFSQKLLMPRPTGEITDAGSYQRIWVVPGQTYTATAKVYLKPPSDQSYAGEDLVAWLGLHPFGEENGKGGGIVWSSESGTGIGTPNKWITTSVSVKAIYPVMTLSLKATRKWIQHSDDAAVWFDEITFTGPVPTGQRPGPEPEPIDPETLIPATTGPNLVANSSFEQPFVNGLSPQWNKWSTIGAGTWRQSTLLGKIGGGKYGGGGEGEMIQMGAKTNLLFGADPKAAHDGTYGSAGGMINSPIMDNAIFIGRPWVDDYIDEYLGDPVNKGRWLADRMWIVQQRHPRIDCWQALNEPDWGPRWQQVVQFEKAFADRCHELGMKTCSLNLSTGSPGNIWRMVDESFSPSARDLLATADYLGHHCYGGADSYIMVNYDQTRPGISSPCDFALRPRRMWDLYFRRGWRFPPVIATEGSTWGGWHDGWQPGVIGADIVRMGEYMQANRWWCGYTNFTCGAYGSGIWEDWDIVGYPTIINAIENFNKSNPADAMHGLYSQMFGAGKVHPYTVAEMVPSGLFDGGINQQLTGLTPGREHLFIAWIKYEFRGRQPSQLKFHLGVDLSGQTSNGNAPTIDWGEDQIPTKAPVHEIFSHVWRTFTPTSATASIWLRASQAISDPSFMFYVDQVEVKAFPLPPGPALQLGPAQITINTPPGANPPPTNFTVRNSGAGSLTYAIEEQIPWLSVAPTAGSSSGETDTINVTFNAESLGEGQYMGIITVSSPEATNSPQSLPVTLTIASGPRIAHSVSSLFRSTNIGSNAQQQTFTVQNSGGGTLNYQITDDADWLSVSPATGTSTGEADTITVNYTTSNLTAGTHQAKITVSDPVAVNNPQQIAVTVKVIVPPCTNNNAANPGFEEAILSPWVMFGTSDGVFTGTWDGAAPHGGNRMFGARGNWVTKNGGAYQQISVCPGATCGASAWIYTRQIGGANWDVICRIGIDPTGGSSAASAGITWSNWTHSQTLWSQISVANVVATGATVTLFLQHEHKFAIQFNLTMFDDVNFTATGGEPPADIPGDFDGDGDVDQDDFGIFQSCSTGPGLGPVASGCEKTDLDQDNDVDQEDFAVYQRCISGYNMPGNPHCTD